MQNIKIRFLKTTVGAAMYARFVVPHYHAYTRVNGGTENRVRLPDCDLSPEFIADPFLLSRDGENWLFFEGMRKKQELRGAAKGVIACFREVDGKWRYQGVVLEAKYHLSYPQVFILDGHTYMIPESAQSGEVALYEAANFPSKWGKKAILLRGRYVDSSIVIKDGVFYLFTTPEDAEKPPELWFSDSLIGGWRRHPMSYSVSGSMSLRRSGGAIYEENGRLTRVVQDCDGGYGRRLFCIPISELTPDSYCEGEAKLLTDVIGWNQNGLHHTYNRLVVGDCMFEVVDRHYNTFKSPLAFMEAVMWYIIDGFRYVARKISRQSA